MKFKNIFDRPALNRVLQQLSLVMVGTVIGVLVIKGSVLELDPKFSIVDFLTLLVAFLLTFTLKHALTSRADDDRIEKDLIIANMSKVSSHIGAIGKTCADSAAGELASTDAKIVLGQFRDLNNELHALEPLLQLTPIRLDLNKFRQIKSHARALKQRTTGKTFPAAPLDSSENAGIQTDIRRLHAACVRFVFYVNRL